MRYAYPPTPGIQTAPDYWVTGADWHVWGLSSSSENPQAAVDVLERIEQSTSLLADHPDHGQSVGMIDNRYFVAIIDNMNAELLYRFREEYSDGALMEVVIWLVPKPVPGSGHPYKYRLFYGYPGQRLVGYDNERGKGDHRHRGDLEVPYPFVTPEKLIDDFLGDIEKLRSV